MPIAVRIDRLPMGAQAHCNFGAAGVKGRAGERTWEMWGRESGPGRRLEGQVEQSPFSFVFLFVVSRLPASHPKS